MPTFADFFAGIGLVSIALEEQGWTGVWSNDIDPDKKQMHDLLRPGGAYRLDDVRNIRGSDIPRVDLAHASFPCIDLSLAGNRSGLRGEQSSLVREFLRILSEMAKLERLPPLVTLENVPGWLTSAKGADLFEVLSELGALGYYYDVLLLDAVRFVPQSRPRIYVIAHLGESLRMRKPHLGIPPSTLHPRKVVEFVNSHPELNWGLLDLPEPPSPRTDLMSVLEDLGEDDPAWWPNSRVQYLLGQMKPAHLTAVNSAAVKTEDSAFTVYRRMRGGRSMAEVRGDGVAGCLRTPRGGSSRQILVMAGSGRIRARLLTPRECARLQGLSDRYSFENVPYNQALWGFGDAVCIPAVEWIAANALNPLIGCEGLPTASPACTRPRE